MQSQRKVEKAGCSCSAPVGARVERDGVLVHHQRQTQVGRKLLLLGLLLHTSRAGLLLNSCNKVTLSRINDEKLKVVFSQDD